MCSGFVRQSTFYFLSRIWTCKSPTWALSRTKWCWISICFVLACKTGFATSLIHDWLSLKHNVGTFFHNPNSANNWCKKTLSFAALKSSRYSAFVVDYNLLLQSIVVLTSLWTIGCRSPSVENTLIIKVTKGMILQLSMLLEMKTPIHRSLQIPHNWFCPMSLFSMLHISTHTIYCKANEKRSNQWSI